MVSLDDTQNTTEDARPKNAESAGSGTINPRSYDSQGKTKPTARLRVPVLAIAGISLLVFFVYAGFHKGKPKIPKILSRADVEAVMARLPDEPLEIWDIIKTDDDLRPFAFDKFTRVCSALTLATNAPPKFSLPGYVEFCREAEKKQEHEILSFLIMNTSEYLEIDDGIMDYWRGLLNGDHKGIAYLAMFRLEKEDPSVVHECFSGIPYDDIPAFIRKAFFANPYMVEIRNKRYKTELERYLLSFEKHKGDPASPVTISPIFVEMLDVSAYSLDDDYYGLIKPEIFPVYEEGMKILQSNNIDPLDSGLPDILANGFYHKKTTLDLIVRRFLKSPTEHNRNAVLFSIRGRSMQWLPFPDDVDRFLLVSMLLKPELPENREIKEINGYYEFYIQISTDLLRRYIKQYDEIFASSSGTQPEAALSNGEEFFLRHLPLRIE